MSKLKLNVGLPTNRQWKNVLTALVFSFISTFLAAFTAGGGIQTEFDATINLAASAAVSAINATLYALWITFFKGKES